MKVVIYTNYGGFCVPEELWEEVGCNSHNNCGQEWTIDRTDKRLIEAIEARACNNCGEWKDFKVVTIPDDVEYTIKEYDGMEHIAEVHRTWR